MNIEGIKQKARRDEVKDFCKLKELPPVLTKRISKQINYQLEMSSVFDEQAILNTLPYEPRSELITRIIKEQLDPDGKIAMFNIKNMSFITELFVNLRAVNYIEHETVIERRAIITEIVFLAKGRMAVMEPPDEKGNSEVIEVLDGSGAVSVAGAILKEPQPVTVNAQSNCYAMVLNSSKLHEIANLNSEIMEA